MVRLGEDSRPSLTPPFPASVRFAIALPDSPFLAFAPALVARQEVRRAGVEFVVKVGVNRRLDNLVKSYGLSRTAQSLVVPHASGVLPDSGRS